MQFQIWWNCYEMMGHCSAGLTHEDLDGQSLGEGGRLRMTFHGNWNSTHGSENLKRQKTISDKPTAREHDEKRKPGSCIHIWDFCYCWCTASQWSTIHVHSVQIRWYKNLLQVGIPRTRSYISRQDEMQDSKPVSFDTVLLQPLQDPRILPQMPEALLPQSGGFLSMAVL